MQSRLVARSIEIIRDGQAASGAYAASPTFSQYRDFCWFRDGAFIAEAMSRVGEIESAERFFDWCAEIVRRVP
jgi:isomaltose glucohydrolase